jgi:S1-C subfamily serine protease
MNMSRKNLALAVVAMLSFSLAGVAVAGQPLIQQRLAPYLLPSGAGVTPRLGFWGHMQYGKGMVVDRIQRGSVAARVGLERGDVIQAINGRRVHSTDRYHSLLRDSGGRVRLHIRDVRSGNIVIRSATLDNGSGPIGPRARPFSAVDPGDDFASDMR